MRHSITIVLLVVGLAASASPRIADKIDRLVACEPSLLDEVHTSFEADVVAVPEGMPTALRLNVVAVLAHASTPWGRRLVVRPFAPKRMNELIGQQQPLHADTLEFADVTPAAAQRFWAQGRRLGRLTVGFRRGVAVRETSPTRFEIGDVVKIRSDYYGVVRVDAGSPPQILLAEFSSLEPIRGARSRRTRLLKVLGPDAYLLNGTPVVVIHKIGRAQLAVGSVGDVPERTVPTTFTRWRSKVEYGDARPHQMTMGPFRAD